MPDSYYALVRHDVLDLIECNNTQRIIEFGCGEGRTLAYLKANGYACFVAGVEREEHCFPQAERNTDLFVPHDVETLSLDAIGTYDLVLLLDVLEHLVDPYATLKKIIPILNPQGAVVVSLPNVRNLAVIRKLIVDGLWDYEDSGILDSGHLRFFTRKSFLKNLASHCPSLALSSQGANPNRDTFLSRQLGRLPFIGEFFVCQHLFKFRLRN